MYRVQHKLIRLGEIMLLWRQSKGLNVREAGAIIGMSFTTLNRLERGENPDGRTLAKILRFLLEEI